MQIILVSLWPSYTKVGKKETVRNAEEFKGYKGGRVEEELEREFEETFQERARRRLVIGQKAVLVDLSASCYF